MSWIIPKYYYNIDHKQFKCYKCGIEIILIPNTKSEDKRFAKINLDHSIHEC